MILHKHYIRTNENNEIIHSFSDAFEQPIEGDILFQETKQRHCQLQVMSEKYFNKYRYKYINGQIIEKTEDELFPLEKAKLKKIKEIKSKAENLIISQYPIFKQINLISKMNPKDTEAKKQTMFTYINGIRDQSDLMEEQVNLCNNKEEVNNFIINF